MNAARILAIDALVDMVKGGALFIAKPAIAAGFTPAEALQVERITVARSLNDARALHTARLPGWGVDRVRFSPSGAAVVQIAEAASAGSSSRRRARAEGDDPARAWLLAILAAERQQAASP